MKPEEFITFWRERETGPDDAGLRLFEAWTEKETQISDLRGESIRFLVPVETKNGWVPGFSEGVAEVGEQLNAALVDLEAIGADMVTFSEIAGGPTLQPLLSEVAGLRSRIVAAGNVAKVARRQAEDPRRGKTLAEIAKDPAVVEAEKDLTEAKKGEATITKLETRISEARAIAQKYA